MLIRRILYFTGGLLVSVLSLWFITRAQINSVSDTLPIAPFVFYGRVPFIHVDHNTVIQRHRFSQPLGVSVRTPYVLRDTGVVPQNVAHEWVQDANPIRIQLPEFVHTNVNEHYIGRLEIPALGISDGVYFSGDDFYLRRNWRGAASNGGELYIDGRSSGNLFRLDNLINGHNMNNGTKFGNLYRVRYAENPVHIFINEYSTGRTFIYEIFAARIVRAQDTGVHLNFSSSFVRKQYYQIQIENSFLPQPESLDFSAPILTLNTCCNSIRDGHLLVFATLIGWQ